jgi:hypothetical protein
MNRLKICLTVVCATLSCLVSGQWSQLGSNMPGEFDSEFGNNSDFNYAGDVMIGGANSNYAKVYHEEGGVWTQLGNTLTGPIGEVYGWGVSINGQGDIIAVGEFGAEGKIHVYELVDDVWTPLGMPMEGGIHNGYYDNFGFAVDLNEAGDRLVASSLYGDLGNGTESGFVQAYEFIDGEWQQIGSSLQGAGVNSHFGVKVAMNATGSRFLVGADSGAGAIYVYEEVDGDWQLLGQELLGSELGINLMYNGTIDKIGNTIAFTQYTGPQGTYVYTLEDNMWLPKGTLVPLGGYCSLNGDGSILGVSRSNGGDGLARVYQFQTDDWVQLDDDISGDSGDYLGVSNDLNYTGNRFLIGAVGAGPSLTGATKVYINGNISYAPIPYLSDLPVISAGCSVESLDPPLAYNNNDDAIVGVTATEFPILESTTVIWTYDDGNGFVSTQEQEVVINDTQAPVPDLETLADVVAECEITTLNAPTATDDCADEVLVSHNATLPLIEQGSTTITWTYDDGNGNTSTQEQTLVISDTSAPVPSVETLEDLTAACEITSLDTPNVVDNCSTEVAVSHDATLPITDQGTTTVIWTYDDGHGNTSTQEQLAVITDTTSPVPDLEALPEITAVCQVLSLYPPTATDNCATTVTVENDAVLPIATPGSTTVTWTYDDGNGNTTEQIQTIIIEAIDASITLQTNNSLMANAEGVLYHWVDCNNGNADIEGETNQVFAPSTSGNYAVIISDNGCEEMSECIEVIVVSVEERLEDNLEDNIIIYPNPSNGIFLIHTSQAIVKVEMYDMAGQLIDIEFIAPFSEVIVDHIENGNYVVRVETDKGVFTETVSIMR